MTGDWWLDLSLGTPYRTKVLGTNTSGTRDAVMRARAAQTPGVNAVLAYASQVNRATRAYTVQISLDTIYGATQFQSTAATTTVAVGQPAFDPTTFDAEFDSATPTVTTTSTSGFQIGFAQ